MKPLLLCILDGVGIRSENYGNAFRQASTPNFDYLVKTYPHSLLNASGTFVGLPDGQMGNSEVGHMNIGTGRVVKQSLSVITQAIEDKSIIQSESFQNLLNHIQQNNSSLHVCGLISPGGIHSHIDHLLGLVDIFKKLNIEKVYYHLFTDGRDTLPYSSLEYINKLQEQIKNTNQQIATISGRYYAMDRDNRWERTKKVYEELTSHTKVYSDIEEVIKNSYKKGVTDEFIEPFSVSDGIMKENDGILVFNFRPDRLKQLFTALTNPDFKEFNRKFVPNLKLVTMMPVSENVICESIFNHPKIDNYLGKILENNNIKQLRIAETEKYPHVTYFFNGENNVKLNNCDEILIPSPKVATYDLKPEMSAYEITDKLLNIIDNYEVIILNFANGDMVGHTGNFEKTKEAVQVLDKCLGKLYEKINLLNGTLIVAADHGNCDWMLEDGHIITSHSLAKVPFIITKKGLTLKNGSLSDIAPTILDLLEIEIPEEMTGQSLIDR